MYHDLKAREQFQVALDQSPVSFRPHLSAQPTRLFGFELVRATRDDMAENLVANARYGLRRVVAFLNAHCVNVASRSLGSYNGATCTPCTCASTPYE